MVGPVSYLPDGDGSKVRNVLFVGYQRVGAASSPWRRRKSGARSRSGETFVPQPGWPGSRPGLVVIAALWIDGDKSPATILVLRSWGACWCGAGFSGDGSSHTAGVGGVHLRASGRLAEAINGCLECLRSTALGL